MGDNEKRYKKRFDFLKHPLFLILISGLFIWYIQQAVLMQVKREEKVLDRKYEVLVKVSSIPSSYYQEMWNFYTTVQHIREMQANPEILLQQKEEIEKYEERAEKYKGRIQSIVVESESVGAQLSILFESKEIASEWQEFLKIYHNAFYPITREGTTEKELNEKLDAATPHISKVMQEIYANLRYADNKGR